MANYNGEELDRRARRRRYAPSPPPRGDVDWRRLNESDVDSPPHRTARRGEIERVDEGKNSSLLRRSRTSWSSPIPATTMPLLTRSSTVQYRRGKDPYAYVPYDQESQSGSRPSSRRDASPRSAHYYRSTPDSKTSSRSSISGSEADSDTTVSSQDERHDRPKRHVRHHTSRQHQHRHTHHAHHDDSEERRPSPADKRRRHRRQRDPVIYEEDRDMEYKSRRRSVDTRTSPSRQQSRQSSRHSSDRHGSGSSVRRSHHHRHSYIEGSKPPNSSTTRRATRRPSEKSDVVYTDARPSLRRSNTTSGGSQVTSHSTTSSTRRSSTFLGGFFGPGIQSRSPEKPAKQVECVVCMDDLPATKAAKLKCGHRMCNSCLKRSFKLSITDPQHMPPRCCTADHIPLRHVDRLFTTDFKKTWNKKFAEFSTRNRIYCPSKRCGEWIKPENIHREDGRKYAKCGRCKTKVCCICNGKWHASRDCPKDEETNKFLEQAKSEGWQRCFKCRNMVELKEGCNHMTCRCGAEFCMICGTKWKNCDCPWFNYEAVENDRLEHMQIPTHIRADRFDRLDANPPSPRGFRPQAASGPIPPTVRPRPQNYEDEMLLRRLQEQRDESLARRLQRVHHDDDDDDDDYQGGIGDIMGIGNSAGHFMNENYRRRPRNIQVPEVPAPPPGPLPPFERANTAPDYISSVNRARGVRGDSLDRLADRFSENRQSPGRRQGAAGMMPPPPPPPSHPHGPHPLAQPPPPHPGAPVLRRHTLEEDVYNNARTTRPSERVVPGRVRHDYAAEAAIHAPSSRRRPAPAAASEPKSSSLAGLTGPGTGMNRVFEWRNHVAPGVPDSEVDPPI